MCPHEMVLHCQGWGVTTLLEHARGFPMNSMLDFSGYAVLVTGGSNSIGRAIAQSFLNADAMVSITGTKPTAADYEADLSAAALGARCRFLGRVDTSALMPLRLLASARPRPTETS